MKESYWPATHPAMEQGRHLKRAGEGRRPTPSQGKRKKEKRKKKKEEREKKKKKERKKGTMNNVKLLHKVLFFFQFFKVRVALKI